MQDTKHKKYVRLYKEPGNALKMSYVLKAYIN